MCLFCFADEKSMDETATWCLLPAIRRGSCDVRDDGIGAERQATHSVRLKVMMAKQFEDRQTGETATLGVQRGGAAVDVVVTAGAGGELKVSQPE
jgi:hypothetical protein